MTDPANLDYFASVSEAIHPPRGSALSASELLWSEWCTSKNLMYCVFQIQNVWPCGATQFHSTFLQTVWPLALRPHSSLAQFCPNRLVEYIPVTRHIRLIQHPSLRTCPDDGSHFNLHSSHGNVFIGSNECVQIRSHSESPRSPITSYSKA